MQYQCVRMKVLRCCSTPAHSRSSFLMRARQLERSQKNAHGDYLRGVMSRFRGVMPPTSDRENDAWPLDAWCTYQYVVVMVVVVVQGTTYVRTYVSLLLKEPTYVMSANFRKTRGGVKPPTVETARALAHSRTVRRPLPLSSGSGVGPGADALRSPKPAQSSPLLHKCIATHLCTYIPTCMHVAMWLYTDTGLRRRAYPAGAALCRRRCPRSRHSLLRRRRSSLSSGASSNSTLHV